MVEASLSNVSHSAIWHTLISTLIWSLSQANWASGLLPTPPHHLWIPPMKRREHAHISHPIGGLTWDQLTNEHRLSMCDHLSIILGARGDSCKFSAPGRTITGPASDLSLSSLHCHALTHCALVPRPARPQGDKKLKTRAKSLMDAKWWAGVLW